jgi:23S rRNA pseudouridine1911/1915/1917 synthase
MSERFVLDADVGRERIDKVLTRLMAPRSRATIQRWIDEGRVRANGVVCRGRDPVRPGMVLEVEPGPEPLSDAEPDAAVPFQVLFEDAHLIVVDKPAGVVVHPARGHRSGTLVSGLLARPGFERAPADERDPEGHLRPGIVHRIDKDTSGLLVIAKDAVAREGLKEQLAAHRMERVYEALTLGVPSSGRIETLYGRHPKSRLRFSSRVAQGKRAVTHVRVLETHARLGAARVECRLETGRTHQIRVHLAEQAQTPLLSDTLYGTDPSDPALLQIARALGRQALHARVLGFRHPNTGAACRFESPPPADFAEALEGLRALASA